MIRGAQYMWRFPKCFFFLVSILLLTSLPLLASGNKREVMTEPTNGDVRVVLRYSVGPGNVDEVRKLIPTLVRRVQSEDKGILHYEFYLNEAESEMYLLARWKDYEALVAHMAQFAEEPTVLQLLELAPINRAESFGDITAEQQDRVSKRYPHIPPGTLVSRLDGFTR